MLRALSQCLSPTLVQLARTLHPRIYTTQSTSKLSDSRDEPPVPRNDPTWAFFMNFDKDASTERIERSVEELWENNSRLAKESLLRPSTANAYTGRSVKVINGNVGDAYRKLDICLSRNRVRYELKLAERHEKKGVKRRRLESERWRKQFANEVRKKVLLVNAIRRRGA